MTTIPTLYKTLESAQAAVVAAEWNVFDSLVKAGHKEYETNRFYWSEYPETCNVSNEYRYGFQATPEVMEVIVSSGIAHLVGSPNHIFKKPKKERMQVEMVFFGMQFLSYP